MKDLREGELCVYTDLERRRKMPEEPRLRKGRDMPMYVYCMFCETDKGDHIAKAAERYFPCRAIYPKQVQHIRKKGQMLDVVHNLLPGYVFLYFENEKPNRTILYQNLVGIIRFLSDHNREDDCRNYELSGADEAFALTLLEKNGVIGKTQVYQEGDRIRIKDGVFQGLNCSILKVDRRYSRMQIQIPFVGQMVKTWVEYEIVEREEGDE